MSDIKTRKYRCNGCGEDRPCYLTTNQEPHTLDYMQLDDLKCVLDETNQTSYNWNEVQANEVEYRADIALHKHIVSHRTFKPNDTEVEDMAVQIDKFINQHALAKPGTYSRKLREFLANKLNEYGG